MAEYRVPNALITLHGVPDEGIVYLDYRTVWLWALLQLSPMRFAECYPEHNSLYEGKLIMGDVEKDVELLKMFKNKAEGKDYENIY